jgi:hypothetical protein
LLQSLAAELAITLLNGEVWLSIGEALLFGGVSLLFGIWVARWVGLLSSDAPAGETLGVGLASGLLVLAAWWAAIWSGGRSSFTPVAIGFGIAIALALVRRRRVQGDGGTRASAPPEPAGNAPVGRWSRHRSLVLTTLAGGAFVVAVALLYGSTMAPSPRDGVQPVENNDEAFYSILGRDLAVTGSETNLSASGFTDLPGLPSQVWYHWGELWLASAVITIFGAAPLAARYFVVLPVALLASAALTGTLVRRMTRTSSRRAYLFGFLVCLFLAPVSLIPGHSFSGLIFEITLYGLAAVAALLALCSLAVLPARTPTWALAAFVGSAVAFILPAHVVIALLALVGVSAVWAIRVTRSVTVSRRLPALSTAWRRTLVATGTALVATVVWGLATGHGLGGSGGVPPSVSSFNGSWRESVAVTALGGGALFAIPLAWILVRKSRSLEADLYLGTMVILVVGAIGWGARPADVASFHFLYAGIAVFATPVAAVAAWTLWRHLRVTRHLRLAAGVAVLCLVQLEAGVVMGTVYLEAFGPGDYQPIPVSILTAIRQLPGNAKLAYACWPLEEVSFADQRLLSIDAHTGRRVVPMCFQADTFSPTVGGPLSLQTPNQGFDWTPQAALYPDAGARPSSAAVAAFLKDHGIDYIYADARHPNSLVAGAVPLATTGDVQILRVP